MSQTRVKLFGLGQEVAVQNDGQSYEKFLVTQRQNVSVPPNLGVRVHVDEDTAGVLCNQAETHLQFNLHRLVCQTFPTHNLSLI